jgi:RNA polymerase sigma-70 factor, ECF subfamily
MTDHDSFNALMQRLRGGEDAAARQVFARFAGRLIGLARCQLAPRLAQRIDPEDVVQSVYKSFFHRYGAEALAADEDGLWGLLARITVRKCADRARYHQAGCRDVDREEPGGGAEPWPDPAGREPTPDEAAVLAETVEGLMRGLDGDERPIIELSLQGHSTQEISRQLGRAERSVRRLRERVRKQLERMHQEGLSDL